MTTSRFPAAIAVVTLALASCGSAGAEILDLGGSPAANRSASGELAVDSGALIAPLNITYSASEELTAEPGIDTSGSFRAWRFDVPSDPAAYLRRVVTALGMSGKVSKDADGNYTLRNGDRSLASYGDAASRWWSYSTPSAGGTAVSTSPCEPADRSADSVPAPDAPGCAEPPVLEPTRNLPTEAEARAATERFMAAVGHDDDGTLEYLTESDQWSVRVNVQWMMGKDPGGAGWYFAYGEGGSLVSAFGQMFVVREADRYPVVSIDEAIERLNTGMYSMLPMGWSAWSPTGSATRDQSSSGKTEVELRKVVMSLMPYWTSAGRQMLLPAYTFTGAGGETVQVLAVRDEYISRPVPSTGDVVVDPGLPGTGGGSSGGGSTDGSPSADVPVGELRAEDASVLVGLAEDEAAKVAEGNGWTVRVAERDGEKLMVTTDWQPNRVNVAVRSGRITEVLSVG